MPARALLAGLITLLLFGCGDEERRAVRARERAQEALAKGERDQALDAIDSLRRAQPADAAALEERARLLIQAGEAARVVWLLEEGLERFPQSEGLRLLLAEAALLVSDPDRAARALATLGPDSERAAEALLLRARAAMNLGDLEQALALFRQAEKRDPRRTALRGPRIGALLAEGRLEEAGEAVAEARRQARGDAELAVARSFELTLQQFRVADARARLQRATLEGDGNAALEAREALASAIDDVGALARSALRDLPAWQSWVLGLIASGRADEARSALDAARHADPDWLPLHALRVQTLLALADAQGAEAALREGITRDPSPAAALPLVRFLSAYDRGDEALEILDAALVDAPDEPLLLAARAELLLDLERADEADRAIAALAHVRPDAALTDLLRARLALSRGDPASAVQQLRSLAPRLDTAATQYWLARALEASGDVAGAERRYALATLRAPSEPGAYAAIARLARQRGAWREAAAAGQQLVLRAPGAIDGWEALVEALLNLGEVDAAQTLAERCAKLLPDEPAPVLLRARALRAAGRGDEARKILAQARERFGDGPEIAGERVLALAGVGRSDDAVAEADRALAASPGSAPLHHARAVALFGAGRWPEGEQAVDAALDHGSDLRPLRTRCHYAAASGRLDAARRDCRRYLETHPDDAGIQFVLGVVLDQAGDPEGAAAAYERAAARDPSAAAPRNNLAHLRFAAGDLEGALEAAQQAYALSEDDPQILDTLATLYLAKGLRERALALLERAHALAPDDAEIERRLGDARTVKP